MKTNKGKKIFLEALKENHIILAVCRKTGIGKSSFYRWLKDDPQFATAVDEAIQEGLELVNDAAESNIVTGIKNRDKDASKFWLKYRHPAYSTKIQVEATRPDPDLTPEQQAIVLKALELAALEEFEEITQTSKDDHVPKNNLSKNEVAGPDHPGSASPPGGNAG